jgi:hypothetical protein
MLRQAWHKLRPLRTGNWRAEQVVSAAQNVGLTPAVAKLCVIATNGSDVLAQCRRSSSEEDATSAKARLAYGETAQSFTSFQRASQPRRRFTWRGLREQGRSSRSPAQTRLLRLLTKCSPTVAVEARETPDACWGTQTFL